MKERKLYVQMKGMGKTVGFELITDKPIKELKEFYRTWGSIVFAGSWEKDVWSALNWITWILCWQDIGDIVKEAVDVQMASNYKDIDGFDKYLEKQDLKDEILEDDDINEWPIKDIDDAIDRTEKLIKIMKKLKDLWN